MGYKKMLVQKKCSFHRYLLVFLKYARLSSDHEGANIFARLKAQGYVKLPEGTDSRFLTFHDFSETREPPAGRSAHRKAAIRRSNAKPGFRCGFLMFQGWN